MGDRMYYVYIISNPCGSVFYVGVTNDLFRRMQEHKQGRVPGFTSKYNVKKLLYFEATDYHLGAIQREKQLKGWRREKKERLVNSLNPNRLDLHDALLGNITVPLHHPDEGGITRLPRGPSVAAAPSG